MRQVPNVFDKVKLNIKTTIFIICNFRRFIIFIIFLECLIFPSLFSNQSTVTNGYGRISNINAEKIYVSASLSVTNCIRQCTEFTINHMEYTPEDCYAYNYAIESYTCELIHSTQPLQYTIDFETKWMTGFKYND